MADIMVLNGAARKNGSTAALVKAFAEGALKAGNSLREFYLQDMSIRGCLGCGRCGAGQSGGEDLCVQHDDMAGILRSFMIADVVVFASPVYFWTVSGPLKTAADRLYAALRHLGYEGFRRKSVLLMTAGGSDYSQAIRWYETFERNLGWTGLGKVLGAGRTEDARRLGSSIR
ncbi:MAG: flavodoxin family protein [Mailhella sp.]|nr:flavodoxin family protein [Mailhella sp.]